MKTKILFALGFLGIGMLACQKEAPELVQSNETMNASFKVANGPWAITTFQENTTHPTNPCTGQPKDCAEPILTQKAHKADFNAVFTAIQGGNQPAIQSAFNTYKTTLKTYLADQDVDGVINGTKVVTSERTNPSATRYMVFRTPSTNAVEFVYPIN